MAVQQIPKTTRIWTDLDLAFIPHPVTGDIVKKYDEDAVKTSLVNLIMTANFERKFHSEIGSPIPNLLFEPITPLLSRMVKKTITDVITSFEPRVSLIDVLVSANPDQQQLLVKIIFSIVNTTTPLQLTLLLDRTR